MPAHMPFEFPSPIDPPPYMSPSLLFPPPSQLQEQETTSPSWCGMPLKYISLITLAVQNAALTIIMHHSRVSTPPSRAYSAASAVLLNELLKGFISLAIAVSRVERPQSARKPSTHFPNGSMPPSPVPTTSHKWWLHRFRQVGREVFSDDCWKLAIPAVLYVIQNNLQYVAVANLDVATFTVTYQMKILTTAAFSVAMLGKKIGPTKWFALFFLAVGVGIVQVQAGSNRLSALSSSDQESTALPGGHAMQPLKGFLAVTAACFTSGAAGVYFEMVLKGSKADLWVRNVQLSLFSLLPALLPILFSSRPSDSAGWFFDLFRNFGLWAWATVVVQVFGGLVTAVVIKYSDNILKGFATSLSIIISFLASVALFNFHITPGFLFGSTTVLMATYMYNKPACKTPSSDRIDTDLPVFGQLPSPKKRYSLTKVSPRSVVSALGTTEMSLYGQSYYSSASSSTGSQTPLFYSPSPSPPSSIPPTRPPSAQRPALGPIDTKFVDKSLVT